MVSGGTVTLNPENVTSAFPSASACVTLTVCADVATPANGVPGCAGIDVPSAMTPS